MRTIAVDAVVKRQDYQNFTHWGRAEPPLSFAWLQNLKRDLGHVRNASTQPIVLEETTKALSEMERVEVNRLVFELARVPVEGRVFSKAADSVLIEIQQQEKLAQFTAGGEYVPKTTLPAGYDVHTIQEGVYWFFFTREELMRANLIVTAKDNGERWNRLAVPIWEEQDSIVHQILGTTTPERETGQASEATDTGVSKSIAAWNAIADISKQTDATEVVQKTAREKILNFIEQHDHVTTGEILAQKFCSDVVAKKRLKQLVEDKKISKVKHGVYTAASLAKVSPSR